MATEVSAEREGQVLQQLNRLDVSLEGLHSSIDALEKRLSAGVLRPVEPSPVKTERDEKDKEVLVELAARIREKASSVSSADQHVQGILARLEI